MHIGFVGLDERSENLVRNFLDQSISVGVYDKNFANTLQLEKSVDNSQALKGYKKLSDLITNLKKPAKIILMISDDKELDEILNHLDGFLTSSDVVMDFGNSHYINSRKRIETYKFGFLDVGMANGSDTHRRGAHLMIGGKHEVFESVRETLETISFKKGEDDKFVKLVGESGAGHLVKMIFDVIECAEIVMYSEIYAVFQRIVMYEQCGHCRMRLMENEEVTPFLSHSFPYSPSGGDYQHVFDVYNEHLSKCCQKIPKKKFLIRLLRNYYRYDALNGYFYDHMIHICRSKRRSQYVLEKIDDKATFKPGEYRMLTEMLGSENILSVSYNAYCSVQTSQLRRKGELLRKVIKKKKKCSRNVYSCINNRYAVSTWFLYQKSLYGEFSHTDPNNPEDEYIDKKYPEIKLGIILEAWDLAKKVNIIQNMEVISNISRMHNMNVSFKEIFEILRYRIVGMSSNFHNSYSFLKVFKYGRPSIWNIMFRTNDKHILQKFIIFCTEHGIPIPCFISAFKCLHENLIKLPADALCQIIGLDTQSEM